MSQAAISLNEASALLDNPDPVKRVEAVERVAEEFGNEALDNTQRKLAEQILRVLLHDAEAKVRGALSENLKENNTVPKDIIMQLVDDVDEVALPVLESSEVLTDDDLIEIVNNTDNVDRFMAISNRKTVNEGVSDALIDTGEKKVTKNLLQRAAAKISELSMTKVMDNFGEDSGMMETLASRESLPSAIVEKVIKKVGSSLQSSLVEKYGHVIPNISEVVEKSQEAATLKFMGLNSSDKEIKHMVDSIGETRNIANDIYERDVELTKTVEKLEASGRLTPVSALCLGNLELFEISLARITNVPVANVKKLLLDEEGKGLEALYTRAKLPLNIFGAVKLVIKVIREMNEEAARDSSFKITANNLISRILTSAEKEKEEIDNLSYFISMIHQHAKLAQE